MPAPCGGWSVSDGRCERAATSGPRGWLSARSSGWPVGHVWAVQARTSSGCRSMLPGPVWMAGRCWPCGVRAVSSGCRGGLLPGAPVRVAGRPCPGGTGTRFFGLPQFAAGLRAGGWLVLDGRCERAASGVPRGCCWGAPMRVVGRSCPGGVSGRCLWGVPRVVVGSARAGGRSAMSGRSERTASLGFGGWHHGCGVLRCRVSVGPPSGVAWGGRRPVWRDRRSWMVLGVRGGVRT
jgi:hypothetical protein